MIVIVLIVITTITARFPNFIFWLAVSSGPFANLVIFKIFNQVDIRFIQILWLSVFIDSFLRKKVKIKIDGVLFFLILYIFFNFLSVLQSVSMMRSLVDAFQFFGLFIIFLILSSRLSSMDDIYIAYKLIILSGVVFLFAGSFQYLFKISLFPQIIIGDGVDISFKPLLSSQITMDRISITRTNALFFGVVSTGCYAAQLLVLYIIGNISAGGKLISHLFVIPMGIFLLFVTYSRSAIFAFLFTMFGVFILNKSVRKKIKIYFCVIFIIPFIIPSVYSRLSESFHIKASTNSQHLIIYFKAISLFIEKPFFGWGSGTSEKLIGKTNRMINIYSVKARLFSETNAVHNIFLQTAAECGIFGLFSILMFIFFLFRMFFLFLLNSETDKIIIAFISASFCGFLIVQISNFFIREAFWIILGVTYASIKNNRYSSVGRKSKLSCPNRRMIISSALN